MFTRTIGLCMYINETLPLKPEDNNKHDKHTVAITKDGDVVGHVSCSISQICWLFSKRGGTIKCRITGKRKLGVGLKVPCVYINFFFFHGEFREANYKKKLH